MSEKILSGGPHEPHWRGIWCQHEAKTLVELFQTQAENLGSQTLFLHKVNRVYTPVSWSETRERAQAVAASLIARGIQPGDRVVILSENRLEWILADLAILHTGAIAVTIHFPLTATQIQEQIADSGATAAFISNEAQMQKLRAIQAQTPTLRQIISFDPVSDAVSFDELEAQGAALLRDKPLLWRETSDALTWDSIATLIYTSGTTGESKGVTLSHGNLLSNLYSVLPLFKPEQPSNTILNLLPLSHIYARNSDYWGTIGHGVIMAFAESIETIAQNLQEVKPHMINGVPRLYEKVRERVLQVTSEKWLYRLLGSIARRKGIKRAFGGQLRYAVSGGAALDPQVAEFYFDHGLPVYQGYGLTETSPVLTVGREGHHKMGTAGTPVPGVEIKIAPDGEILARGPNIMKGYWQKPKETAEAISPDGWFHTGDVGTIVDSRYLQITDRKKDILVLAGGKNIAPVAIETALVRDPFIEQAVVYGDKQKFVSALIVPDRLALTEWAKRKGLSTEPYDALVKHPEVVQKIERQVETAMKDFAPYEQVKKFILLSEPFTLQDGDVTITLKMRRARIIQRYRDAIDALYDG